MTAAKVMNIISRLPGCAGQAADAVSAKTEIKMEDAPKSLKIPKSECPDIWIRLPEHKWPESGSCMKDPVVSLERNLYGHPLAGLLWERQFEKILLKYGWEKVSNWESLFVHREKGYSYLCMWMTSNWLERNKILIRCGKYSWKTLIWENQHHSLTMFIWVALKENVRYARILWIITQVCSNQGFLPGQQKNCQKQKPRDIFMVLWHGRSCEEMCGKVLRTCEKNDWAIIRSRNAMHRWSSIQKKKMEQVENYQQVCAQIALKFLYLARIGRLDILWSVNKLARAITKWTKTCDKR